MITLAIGILLIVFGIKRWHDLTENKIIFFIIAGAVCCFFALMVPIQGFNEPVMESEVVLVPLKIEEESDQIYYVQKNNTGYVYAYDNSEKYGLSGGAYEQSTVYNSTKIYESADCNVPVLKVFVTTSKRGWYTLAGLWDTREYIFYIPEGTVKK